MSCSGDAKLLQLVRLAIVLLGLLICGSEAKRAPTHFVLYAHESRVAPSSTLIVSAAPSGNLSPSNQEFGLIRIISNVLREGPSNTSTILGSQVGIVVLGKDAPVYISYTFYLNDNATNQGTIAVHGHIDGSSTVDRVLAVVGGTGDFLSATGTDTAPDDGTNPPDPANVVNVHTLVVSYPPNLSTSDTNLTYAINLGEEYQAQN